MNKKDIRHIKVHTLAWVGEGELPSNKVLEQIASIPEEYAHVVDLDDDAKAFCSEEVSKLDWNKFVVFEVIDDEGNTNEYNEELHDGISEDGTLDEEIVEEYNNWEFVIVDYVNVIRL